MAYLHWDAKMNESINPIALSAKKAAALLGISERSFHALRSEPDFPRPRSLAAGGRCLRWSIAELEQWLAARPAAAKQAVPPQLATKTYRSGQLTKSVEARA